MPALPAKIKRTNGAEITQEKPVLSLVPTAPHTTPSAIGGVSEITAAADLLRRGCHVYWSMTPTAPCDLIAEVHGRLVRIEVRSAMIRADGQWAFPRPEDKSRYDCIAAVTKTGQVRYYPPLFAETA